MVTPVNKISILNHITFLYQATTLLFLPFVLLGGVGITYNFFVHSPPLLNTYPYTQTVIFLPDCLFTEYLYLGLYEESSIPHHLYCLYLIFHFYPNRKNEEVDSHSHSKFRRDEYIFYH